MTDEGDRLRVQQNANAKSARVWLSALFILGALIPVCLFADVFWRYKKNHSSLLQELGGMQVYSTAVQVNGRPGLLAAYAFDDKSATEIGAQLRGRLSIAQDVPPSVGTMMTSKENGRVQRLLVIPSGYGTSSSLVMAFEQAQQGSDTRSDVEPLVWPDGLAMLPGVPRFTAVCEATRTSFVTAETNQEPEEAIKSVEVALRDSGWKAVPVSLATFKLFVRGAKTCLAFASRPAGAEQTTIGVLQREGSGK